MPALTKFMAMPPPMVPAPMTPTLRISRSGVSSGRSAILAAARSAKNTWRSARDSGVCISDEEALALQAQALVERLAHRRGDRLHALQRRRDTARPSAPTVLRANCRKASACGSLTLTSRRRLSGSFSATTFSAKRHRGGEQVAVGHLVEQRRALELRGRHRGARDDHVERGLQADRARQALRAAGAGQQAQLHLGQRDLRVGLAPRGSGAQRQLEPAAHAHAGDGGDHRFGRILERGDQRRQARLARGLGGAELLDVGAAGKGALAAGDDDGLDVVVGQRAVQRGQQVACAARRRDR